jgi:putative Mg2+ transporter-C (MgtC) family protein
MGEAAMMVTLATVGAPPPVMTEVADLALAVALTGVIGLERELREKNAGLRTHAVIGLGAALFVQLSKYGFADVLAPQRVVLDPSRVAAQIASGIGFVGAGVIFVRRDSVKGLTTAASVWLSAAVGAVAGAGLFAAALLAVSGYLLITSGFTWVAHRLGHWRTPAQRLVVTYQPGSGVLQRVLQTCEASGYELISVIADETVLADGQMQAQLTVLARDSTWSLLAVVGDVPGVQSVTGVRPPEQGDLSRVAKRS